mmetsp:Transcript_20953/g.21628  ORF Transcript_20953/g.21628 Transcript_20953/m.21628 type:complete len:87 (-) Transcript_20953:203-463(-)
MNILFSTFILTYNIMDNSKYIQLNLQDFIPQPFEYEHELRLDWSQLQYNNIYRSYDYFASKFRGDYSNIPGFDKVLQQIQNLLLKN